MQYNNCGRECKGSEDITSERSEYRHFRWPCWKLGSLGYIIVADSMGLSSFRFLWWAPKDMCVIVAHSSRSSSIQGHPRSLILVLYRKCVCDFLSVINSHLGTILHRQNCPFYPSQSHKSLSLGVTPFEFRDEQDIYRNWKVQALGWWRNRDASFLRFGTIPDCDGRTDGRTDRRIFLLWLYQRFA